MNLLQRRLHWQKLTRTERVVQERVAVLATFTANPLLPYIGMALEDSALPAGVWLGPYNQMMQQCLDDESETASFAPTILVAWARLEDLWAGRSLPLIEPAAEFVSDAIDLAEACLDAARRWQTTLVFVLPSIPEERPLGVGDANNATGVFATATAVREALRKRLASQRGVMLVDLEETIRTIGSSHAYNQRLLVLAHIPFSEELFYLIGERIGRLVALNRRPARKVIVLDGDNTLWGGVIGEDGHLGVDLNDNGPGKAFGGFQEFLLALRRAGILLTLCSKNNEVDVWEVFARREMKLKRDMLTAWRIGWKSKSAYICELADELHLGIESFVLIDDNAAEIAEVQSALPGIACIQMPADPAHWLGAVQSSGVLDRPPPTTEDLERATYYQQDRLRAAEHGPAASPEVYLARLDIKVSLFSPEAADLPRLAQLVAKTNQFNLNCLRRSATELEQLCHNPQYVVRLAQARDRFGDYGIIGASIVRLQPADVELDTFVMSCRAMGRGIEEAMLNDLFEIIAQHSRPRLFATVVECPRNEPARTFFARLGCTTVGTRAQLHHLPWPSYLQRQQGASV